MAAFIAQDTLIFDDIRTVLDSQTEHLSDLEREILIWLAIAREPMTLDGLRDALANPVRERTLLEALRALQRRSLMERRGNGFTLQNVINEYLIDTLVDQIVQEIRDERLRLLRQVNFTGSDLSTSIFADRFGLIYSVAFSPDGRLLAAGSAEGRIRFWDIALGQPIQVFQAHDAPVHAVTFSPDGRVLASAGSDKCVRLWDADLGLPLAVLRGHSDEVRSTAFSPDGMFLASGGRDNMVHLWKLMKLFSRDEEAIGTVGDRTADYILHGHTSWVSEVTFSPDRQLLATAGDDNSGGT